jgi:hypothetical protein
MQFAARKAPAFFRVGGGKDRGLHMVDVTDSSKEQLFQGNFDGPS